MVIALLLSAAAVGPPSAADDLAPKLRTGLVRLYVTAQSYDAREPWKKRSDRSRVGRGVVVAPGVVLTRAFNVADARMIEVAVANSARRYPARVKHVDARIGLGSRIGRAASVSRERGSGGNRVRRR